MKTAGAPIKDVLFDTARTGKANSLCQFNDRFVLCHSPSVSPTGRGAEVLVAANTRHGNTLKAVLITLLVVSGFGIALCAGLGVAGYYWLRHSIAKLHVTDPAQVREVTAEISNIELPSELQPQDAVSFLGTRIVEYHWCPSGTCIDENASELTLVSIPDSNSDTFDEVDDDAIKRRFIHFTKSIQEFEIRGKAYPFTFVFGETRTINADEDIDDMEITPLESAGPIADSNGPKPESTESTASAISTTGPADASFPSTTEGKKVWWIFGIFPGKNGRCKLDMQLKSDEYDEAKIHAMLRSIR